MRATIKNEKAERTEKAGFFRTKTVIFHKIIVSVELTPEELDIVRSNNLGNDILFQEHHAELEATYKANGLPYTQDKVNFYLTIDKLIAAPFQRGFGTPAEANQFEHKFRTEILPAFKSHIESNVEQAPRSETFEL